uniref:dihydrolipoyllysine-residue succinyltransferase n=1 Tax=Albugo laibachii Nc14 TaxID=890382 RepID=F0WI11_9STRA|nr:dihydrolipoamide succinyltransferase putative [Albugo laibachii Nc14]|eukprot:CCA20888.1 dihydrolipoamide succinyltransferase putative [Albugo laibachii Nc14]
MYSTETINVPSMGDSISEGTVVEWVKQCGEFVEQDEVIVILETDKVSVDVRSPVSGVLEKQLATIDQNVNVGAPLFQLNTDTDRSVENDPKSSESKRNQNQNPEPSTQNQKSAQDSNQNSQKRKPTLHEGEVVRVPSMGDSISEGTIVQWVKEKGDHVKKDEVVVVIETDKVSVDIRSPKSGILEEMLAKVDEMVQIDAPLFRISLTNDPSSSEKVHQTPKQSAPPKTNTHSSPKAPEPKAKGQSASIEKETVKPLYQTPQRTTRREKMSRMRVRTSERLKESQNTAASLTTFQEVDMTNLMQLRKQYKESFESKHGVKLGFMSAFVKAASQALLFVPGVNAMIDDERQEIVYRDFVDMNVAVSTPKGLVTPVIRNTESLSFAEIEKQLTELADRARTGKITLEEMTGGNFTISNGGVFGSLMGTPIINLPQSGILGMHATKMRPVVVDGKIVARPMMYLALTYDHRIIDGREAVIFLKFIAETIQDPTRMLLDL